MEIKMKGRSDYLFRVSGDFLLIVDQNLGAKSVTSDIEHILNDLSKKGIALDEKYIICQDSEKKYGRILYAGGEFRGWARVNADEIIEIVLRTHKLRPKS